MKSYALICAYNEESTANEVIKNTLRYVDKVIFVNDGSKDMTFELAQKRFGNNKKVIIISYPKNRGKGYAMITGFRRFSKENGDILVTLDADGQHSPKEIPKVMSYVKKGKSDITIGTKYFGSHSQPMRRYLLARASSGMLYLTSGARVKDVSSGFRCYSKKAIKSILPFLKTEDFGIELEILRAAKKMNLKITETLETQISCSYEFGKKSSFPKLAKGYAKFAWKHKSDIPKQVLTILSKGR
ncbi:MAG: glycosyltransferase family 2 protein [Candidatus Aenigmatarchaeota archaeon]